MKIEKNCDNITLKTRPQRYLSAAEYLNSIIEHCGMAIDLHTKVRSL